LKKIAPIKIILSIFFILVCFVVGFVYSYYTNIKNTSDNKIGITPTATETIQESYNTIAYLDNTKEFYPSLVIYNTLTKEKKTDFPELEFAPKVRVSIGKWSPNGQFLPVIASSTINGNYQAGTSYFFFYDSLAEELVQVVGETKNNLGVRWTDSGYLEFTGDWINSTDFLIHMTPKIGSNYNELTVEYINILGAMKEYTVKKDTLHIQNEGIQLQYKSNDLEYKSIGTTSEQLYFDLKFKGTPYVHSLSSYQPIGVLAGKIITLYKPKGFSPLLNPTVFNLPTNLTTEEKLQKSIDLMMPGGKDSLIFSDSIGTKIKEIPLPYNNWTSDEALIIDGTNNIIVHQVERTILLSSERYLLVSSDDTINVLYERIRPAAVKEMINEHKILLSPDKKSLLLYDVDAESTISYFNISTKSTELLCSNCINIKVNNPSVPRIIY
jgi:hypothetical protein